MMQFVRCLPPPPPNELCLTNQSPASFRGVAKGGEPGTHFPSTPAKAAVRELVQTRSCRSGTARARNDIVFWISKARVQRQPLCPPSLDSRFRRE